MPSTATPVPSSAALGDRHCLAVSQNLNMAKATMNNAFKSTKHNFKQFSRVLSTISRLKKRSKQWRNLDVRKAMKQFIEVR